MAKTTVDLFRGCTFLRPRQTSASDYGIPPSDNGLLTNRIEWLECLRANRKGWIAKRNGEISPRLAELEKSIESSVASAD